MESVIKWRTGEPKETGRYIVSTTSGYVTCVFHTKGNQWKSLFDGLVNAWCPCNEIEPYKE